MLPASPKLLSCQLCTQHLTFVSKHASDLHGGILSAFADNSKAVPCGILVWNITFSIFFQIPFCYRCFFLLFFLTKITKASRGPILGKGEKKNGNDKVAHKNMFIHSDASYNLMFFCFLDHC